MSGSYLAQVLVLVMLAASLGVVMAACAPSPAPMAGGVLPMARDGRHFLAAIPRTPTPTIAIALPSPTPLPVTPTPTPVRTATAAPDPTSTPESATDTEPAAASPTTGTGDETPTAAITSTPAADTGAENGDLAETIEQGKEIFQITAGGVGCQLCHGKDAAGLIGPNIQGATSMQILGAFDRAPDMAFIYLENWEIQAVSAYLQTLVE